MNRFAAKTTLAGILASALAISGAAVGDEIRWSSDIGAARRQATLEGKLILLHFESQDCPPCRMVESAVFADEQVIETLNGNYVPVRIDVDEHPELAEAFQVKAWPTDVIVTPEKGEQLYRGTSSPKAATYRTNLELIAQSSQPDNVDPALAEYEAATAQPGMADHPGQVAQGDPLASPSSEGLDSYPPRGSEFAGSPSNATSGGAVAMYAPPKEEIWEPTGPESTFDPQSARPPEATLSQSPRDPMAYRPSDSGLAATPQFDAPTSPSTPYGQASTPPQSNPYQQAGFNGAGAAEPAFDGGFGSAEMGVESGPRPAGVPAIPAGFARPASNPAPATSLRMGLDGVCPVSLVTQEQWVKGNPQFGAKHRGIVYLFADAAARELFLSDPDHFSLAWQGIDAVEMVDAGRTVVGKSDFGVVAAEYGVDGILLFTSEESLAKFGESPESIRHYVQRMESLLHQSSNVAAAPGAIQR